MALSSASTPGQSGPGSNGNGKIQTMLPHIDAQKIPNTHTHNDKNISNINEG